MAKKIRGTTANDKSINGRKMVTTIGGGKCSRPEKKKRNKKRGVKRYRGQGR